MHDDQRGADGCTDQCSRLYRRERIGRRDGRVRRLAWREHDDRGQEAAADRPTLEEVRSNLLGTGYPAERVTFVKGRVEDTLPRVLPGPIALLRLDTAYYESTKRELEQLYPLLVLGGVLIIDDYGHWKGARRAVDEYFAASGLRPFLHRIDYTGRLVLKTGL